MTSTIDGFDIARLTEYLEQHVAGFRGPLVAEKFAGGQSNPTFLLKTQGGSYVLRRQPPGLLPKSAHAVDREFRVLSALANTDVPVVRVYHLCNDSDVIGSMFYVMSFEDGRIFWNPALPDIPPKVRGNYYAAILQAMVSLHGVDVTSAGLGDYGHSGNYFGRQIGVWTKQYLASQTDRIDAIDALIDWLPTNCPDDNGKPALVHGDFRIDNLMFDRRDCRVRALLDWELSTLGNPLADLAYFCMSLRLAPDAYIPGLKGRDRTALGVPEEEEFVARYCELRGIAPIADWHFYLAFSFFRLAAIAQGVKSRALRGNASNAQARHVGDMVAPLAQMAIHLIETH
jgi:aminoglycoside phosphotransferase (APT) family kinase protein